jgi:putative ABC transport system substrate-binding protein
MGSLNELGDQGGEGVLMLPDASVYDSTNVRALLVWAIRQKKPVFTFSDNLVKAGAFAGQYTQPEELGRQTGELIRQILQGKKFENISLQYPNAVLVAVNERTAELIGIPLDDETMKGVTKRYGKDE